MNKNIFLKNKFFWILRVYFKFFEGLLRAVYSGMAGKRNKIYELRRSIHKIEKGLIQKNAKDFFADDYIMSLISLLKDAVIEGCDRDTLRWVVGVLNKYFQVVKFTPNIKKAHDEYLSLGLLEEFHSEWFPYLFINRKMSTVTYGQLKDLAGQRRSIRFYEEKKVDKSLVKKAMEIARLSPSACNRQAYKFVFVEDQKVAKKILDMSGGIKGFDIPNLIVVTGDYSAYSEAGDIFLPVIDASMAAMSFMYALETLGLSSICLNWRELSSSDRLLREIIGLKKSEVAFFLIGFGYPDQAGGVAFSAKRSVDEMLIF